jgi:hypothetical protein
MIPKIIHQIWVYRHWGLNRPDVFMQGWQNLPDWEYKLWGEDDLHDFKDQMVNPSLFNGLAASENTHSMTDYARLEILYHYGGMYLDCDFECTQNPTSLLYLETDLLHVTSENGGRPGDFPQLSGVNEVPTVLTCGFYVAGPKNPIIGKALEKAEESFNSNKRHHGVGGYFMGLMSGFHPFIMLPMSMIYGHGEPRFAKYHPAYPKELGWIK